MSLLAAHETIGSERLVRIGWRDCLLWVGAFATVIVVQTAAVFAITTWRSNPEVPGAPPPAIMIELSEISVAPQVEDIAAEDGELALEQDAAQPAEAAESEPVSETAVETVKPVEAIEPKVDEVAEALLPEPVPEPPTQNIEQVVEADTVDSVEPVTPDEKIEPETTEPIVEAEPLEEIVPDVVESEIAEVFVPMPRTVPTELEAKRRQYAEVARAAEQKRKEAEKKKQKAEQAQQQQAASKQTAPQSVEAEASTKAAASQQTTTTKRTSTVSPQQWKARVQAYVVRAKKYPTAARSRREEGIVHLQFVIDANGNVLSARVVRSSGYASLDQSTIDMIHRISPVPAPPPDMGQPRITLTVPINFNLR